MKLTQEDLDLSVFTENDIYWIKQSGDRVLISKKFDLINKDLIQKLINNDKEVIFETNNDDNGFKDIKSVFTNSSKTIDIRSKILLRKKFFHLINKYVLEKEINQFTLDRLSFYIFNENSINEILDFAKEDPIFFYKVISIAGNLSIILYLIGNYNEQYIKHIYSSFLSEMIQLKLQCPLVQLNKLILKIKSIEDLKLKTKNLLFAGALVPNSNINYSDSLILEIFLKKISKQIFKNNYDTNFLNFIIKNKNQFHNVFISLIISSFKNEGIYKVAS